MSFLECDECGGIPGVTHCCKDAPAQPTPAVSERAAELVSTLRKVSDWINRFPVPTDGATANMIKLQRVMNALSAPAAQQPSETAIHNALIGAANYIDSLGGDSRHYRSLLRSAIQEAELSSESVELRAALNEAYGLVKELCGAFNVPEPRASFDRFDSLLRPAVQEAEKPQQILAKVWFHPNVEDDDYDVHDNRDLPTRPCPECIEAVIIPQKWTEPAAQEAAREQPAKSNLREFADYFVRRNIEATGEWRAAVEDVQHHLDDLLGEQPAKGEKLSNSVTRKNRITESNTPAPSGEQPADERKDAIRTEDFNEVRCSKCELSVLSSCGCADCPVLDMYRALDSLAEFSRQARAQHIQGSA